MIVDITTHNKVFNTLSQQGTWFKHRKGKRNYPELHCDVSLVKKIIKDNPDTEDFVFRCVYGDSAEWPYYDQIWTYFSEQKRLHAVTYGMTKITFSHFRKILLLDGIEEECGKVFLGADWNTIKNNITSNTRIEFYLFEHNQYQIPAVQTFCKELDIDLSFIYVDCDATGYHSVLDENGSWLYDVKPVAYNTEKDYNKCTQIELRKHLNSYNFLKSVRNIKGTSILDAPVIPGKSNETEFEPIKQYSAVATTGHAFNNDTDLGMFMNLICADWELPEQEVINPDMYPYTNYVNGFAQKFANKEYLDSISLL